MYRAFIYETKSEYNGYVWAKRSFYFHLCLTQDRALFSVSYKCMWWFLFGVQCFEVIVRFVDIIVTIDLYNIKWIKSKLNFTNKLSNKWNKLFCTILNFGNIIFLLGITLQGKAVLDSLETLSLTCNATGSERAPGGVDWFHDGIIIRPHDERWKGRLQIYNKKSETSFRSLISQLVIEKSKLEDHGSYICRSSDRETKSIVVSILEGKY